MNLVSQYTRRPRTGDEDTEVRSDSVTQAENGLLENLFLCYVLAKTPRLNRSTISAKKYVYSGYLQFPKHKTWVKKRNDSQEKVLSFLKIMRKFSPTVLKMWSGNILESVGPFQGGPPVKTVAVTTLRPPPLSHMLFSLEFSCRVTWLAKPALLWQPMECVLVYSCVLKNFSAFISGAININRCNSYKQGTLESLVTFKTGRKSKSKRFDNPCSRSSNKVHVSSF